MRNPDTWQPTKFELHHGHWRGSRNPEQLSATSRLIADLSVKSYAEAISRYASGDVLDLGCGQAPLFGIYSQNTKSVTCVDWPNSLHQNSYIDVAADLTKALPLESGIFDTIILTDVMEHIPNPDHLAAEITRVLRSGGHIIIGVPFMYGIHEEPHDYHRYTKHRLRQLCSDHALEVEFLASYGDGWHALGDLVIKQVTGRIRLQWLTSVVTWGGLRHSPRPDTPRPLGYTLVARKA